MPKRLVEITSQHSTLLPSIVKAKQGSPYTIIEREGNYYLSFVDTDDPKNTQKAKQDTDILLANINAILTLPPYSSTPNALKRANRIITIDDTGYEVGESELDAMGRLLLGPDFSTMDFSSLLEMEVKASKLTRIKQALWYYAGELNWFNLYDVYECIRKDIEEIEGEGRKIPEHWLIDSHGRNRLKDFTESANNANISGYAARHTYAESKAIVSINTTLIKLQDSGEEIMPMTLDEAREFIENLMMKWLKYRTIRF